MKIDHQYAVHFSYSTFLGNPAELPPTAASALIEAKTGRDQMVATFQAERPLDPQRIVDSASIHLPHCINMMCTHTAVMAAGTLPITKEEFMWTSVLNRGPRSGQWTSPYGSFDCIFSAHCLAGGYVNLANQTAAEGGIPSIVEASKHLRAAAGVYLYANANIIPRLRSRGSGLHPPEVLPSVLLALASACIAQAQQCAVARAASTGMKQETLLKLVIGVCEKYQEALRHLGNMPPADQELIDLRIMGFMRTMLTIAEGIANKIAGQLAYEKADYSHALGFMQAAKAKFDSLHDLVDIMPEGASFEGIRAEHIEINNLWREYDDESKTVFFEEAAKDCVLPPGTVLMKPTPLEIPIPEPMAVREGGLGSPSAGPPTTGV